MDIVQILAAVASIAAIVGVPIMIVQACDGRKGRQLQEAQADSQTPNFEITDILDAYAVRGISDNVVVNLFVLVTNKSDKPLTMSKIRLNLVGEYRYVTILPTLRTNSIHDGYNIAPNSSATEWIRFSIKNELFRDLLIVKYVLTITDAYGNSDDRTMIYLREVIDKNEKME